MKLEKMRSPLLSFIHGLAGDKSPQFSPEFLLKNADAVFFRRFMSATKNYARCEEFILKYRILLTRIREIEVWCHYEMEIPDVPRAKKRELMLCPNATLSGLQRRP